VTWLARVHVLLKPVVNDPQGQAIQGGLKSLGFDAVQRVRAGKYFEIQVDAPDAAEAARQAEEMCRKLLANPVIEDYRVAVEDQQDVTMDTV
jgi:phosphoribosylformylglycinamidine synthase subunit PurS